MPYCICQSHLSWHGKGHGTACPCHPSNRPVAVTQSLHLEFLLRGPNGERTEEKVLLPCGYAWQEGPDDLHIQFDGPGTDNFCPLMEDGDYVLPHPKANGTVRAYHLGYRPGKVRWPRATAAGKYQARIEALWPSPNR